MSDGRAPFGNGKIKICKRDDAVTEQAIAAGLVERAKIAKTTKEKGGCVQLASPRGRGRSLFSQPAPRGVNH